MIQRQIPHPAFTFPGCATCHHEPRHIQASGSHSREAFDVRRPTGERHRLECRCGEHTAWRESLQLALNDWTDHFASGPHRIAKVRPLLHGLHKGMR